MKFYLMDHRGGLEEALKTIKEITAWKFDELLPFYEPYHYDERIGCFRFILKDMEHEYVNHPVWLLCGDLVHRLTD